MNRRNIIAAIVAAPAAALATTRPAKAAPVAPLSDLSRVSIAQLSRLASDTESAARVFPDHPALRDRLAVLQAEAATRSTDCTASRRLLDLIAEAQV